jgi:nitrate reductase molybdenum cofactor assembly chaperone
MMRPQELLELLGGLLEYPRHGTIARLDEALRGAQSSVPSALPPLREFDGQIRALTETQREELYTRTFDLTPSCDPYLSSQAFGEESYQRGQLMIGLAQAYRTAGYEWEPELPDHVAVVLGFAPRFDRDEWHELVEHCLYPALMKLTSGLATSSNPYSKLFACIVRVVETDVPQACKSAGAIRDVPLEVLSPDAHEEVMDA